MKRARREAEERARNMAEGMAQSSPSQGSEDGNAPTPNLPAPAVTLQGEVLPPESAPEPTRTALKRAMRAKAQQYADEAVEVLVANMRNDKLASERRADAANKLLEWGFGKPSADIDIGAGDQIIVIRRFGEENT